MNLDGKHIKLRGSLNDMRINVALVMQEAYKIDNEEKIIIIPEEDDETWMGGCPIRPEIVLCEGFRG